MNISEFAQFRKLMCQVDDISIQLSKAMTIIALLQEQLKQLQEEKNSDEIKKAHKKPNRISRSG